MILADSCMHEEDGSVTIRDDLDALLQVASALPVACMPAYFHTLIS